MTFLELYDTALDIELASNDSTQLFTTARRKQAIKDAQRTFVRQTGCTKVYGEISLTDEVSEYNILAFLTNYRRLAGAPSIKIESGGDTRYIQGPKDFPRRNPEQLDFLSPGWRAADPSTPTSWYFVTDNGELKLGLSPTPDITSGDVWTLLVPYVAKPDDLSADDDEPFTVGGTVLSHLEPYHQGLVHYAAYVLEPLRKNSTGSERQLRLYSGYVAQYLTDQRQDGQDQITLMRDYLGEGLAMSRAVDPRRFP